MDWQTTAATVAGSGVLSTLGAWWIARQEREQRTKAEARAARRALVTDIHTACLVALNAHTAILAAHSMGKTPSDEAVVGSIQALSTAWTKTKDVAGHEEVYRAVQGVINVYMTTEGPTHPEMPEATRRLREAVASQYATGGEPS